MMWERSGKLGGRLVENLLENLIQVAFILRLTWSINYVRDSPSSLSDQGAQCPEKKHCSASYHLILFDHITVYHLILLGHI